MVKKFLNFCFFFLVFSGNSFAQETNSFDANGKRHGVWQKYFEGSKQLRYKGTFDHGKEVGTFKFYDKSGGHPTAIKKYTVGNDLLDVIFYTKSGKLISKGTMRGRDKEGDWLYFHKDGTSIMTKENFTANKIQGIRTVYFENGNKAQETQYVDGLRQGKDIHYTENGTVLKEYYYVDDKLEGPVKLYNNDGSLLREGQYKGNSKHGLWKYYKNGTLEKSVKFPQNKIGVYN